MHAIVSIAQPPFRFLDINKCKHSVRVSVIALRCKGIFLSIYLSLTITGVTLLLVGLESH